MALLEMWNLFFKQFSSISSYFQPVVMTAYGPFLLILSYFWFILVHPTSVRLSVCLFASSSGDFLRNHSKKFYGFLDEVRLSSNLRLHWRLSIILKTSKKMYEVMFFDTCGIFHFQFHFGKKYGLFGFKAS